VLDEIRTQGLELQVICNKGAVMVLPRGVDKANGLETALNQLSLSRHNAVGVGDAENDLAFLGICECAAAVENALPTVKARADFVLREARGAGVIELIDCLLANDLADAVARYRQARPDYLGRPKPQQTSAVRQVRRLLSNSPGEEQ